MSRIAIGLSVVALFAALGGGAYAATQIGSKNIKANAVKSKQIKDGAVNTAELADGAVMTDKLANDAVTKGKIANGAVDGGQLADNAVSGAKLADGGIATEKLADGSVTSAKAGAGVLRDMVIVEDRVPDTGFTTAKLLQAFATCPDGYLVTGGGGRIIGDDGSVSITEDVNEPVVASGSGLRQWFFEAVDVAGAESAEDYAVDARAICVKA